MSGERRSVWLLGGAWLIVCALMIALGWHAIAARNFPDVDDIVRLLEVRDWLGGQSWFDVTQYRLNSPIGGAMHWSRLVDVPIGAVILAIRPFLGERAGETAALVAVPLVTLGVAMLLVQRIGEKLMKSGPALAAAIATPFSVGGMKQMRPLRIDHHGWQIVLALLGLYAAMEERPRRSGLVAGAAMALWMNISIEGLPFAAAFGALFAWQWIADPQSTERLRTYLASLTLSSLALFTLTHVPSTWLSQPRDVVTAAHLAAFFVAATGCWLAVRSGFTQLWTRVAVLAVLGGLTLATMFAADPHWLQGPFGSLDPLVRQMWYDHVDEGLPVWRIPWSEAAAQLAQPVVGLIGATLAVYRASGPKRELWSIYLYFLAAMTLGGIFVNRTTTTASVIALPGTAFLCWLAYARAQKLSRLPTRVIASAAALSIMAPAYAVPVSVAPGDDRLSRVSNAGGDCVAWDQIDRLNRLPPGEIAASLDVTPAILLDTRHHAIATAHHRNAKGMLDVMRLFLLPPADGAKIVARRHSDYLVFCPGGPEAFRYAWHGRDGLAAMLIAGKHPKWLERVALPGLRGLQIWRVRKDLLAASA